MVGNMVQDEVEQEETENENGVGEKIRVQEERT